MKAQIYDAVFENGIFRPLTPPGKEIDDGQQVRLVVEPASKTDVLQLAAQVYDGLSEDEIESIEQIALDRRNFFENNR